MALTMTDFDFQVAKSSIQSRIDSLTSQINNSLSIGSQWKNQADALTCNQTLKSKRSACESDKAWKNSQAKVHSDFVAGWTAEKSSLATQLLEMTSLQKEATATAGAVSLQLAGQGTTIQAVQTKAELEGKAVIQGATIKASAEAESVLKNAEVEADGKKKIIYLAVGGGVLLLLFVGFLLYKKFKK